MKEIYQCSGKGTSISKYTMAEPDRCGSRQFAKLHGPNYIELGGSCILQ